jgi:hypothetical protein
VASSWGLVARGAARGSWLGGAWRGASRLGSVLWAEIACAWTGAGGALAACYARWRAVLGGRTGEAGAGWRRAGHRAGELGRSAACGSLEAVWWRGDSEAEARPRAVWCERYLLRGVEPGAS